MERSISGAINNSQSEVPGDGQGKTSSSQRCQTDGPTLRPSRLASIQCNDWKIAVIAIGQGLKVPSPDIIFVLSCAASISFVRTYGHHQGSRMDAGSFSTQV